MLHDLLLVSCQRNNQLVFPTCLHRLYRGWHTLRCRRNLPIITNDIIILRTALSTASIKAQQSPLIQSNPIRNQTHSHVTIILKTVTIKQIKYTRWSGAWLVSTNPNPTLTLTYRDLDHHQNLMVSSRAKCHISIKFCEKLLSSFCAILLTNKKLMLRKA